MWGFGNNLIIGKEVTGWCHPRICNAIIIYIKTIYRNLRIYFFNSIYRFGRINISTNS